MKNQFIGTWELLKWELKTSNGDHFSFPYGEDALGRIIYSPEGRMSATLMRSDRSNFERSNITKASESEIVQAFKGYVSYTGTFLVRENTVVHQVDMSIIPNWVGTELIRHFTFLENSTQLLLSTPYFTINDGTELAQVLLWHRVNNVKKENNL